MNKNSLHMHSWTVGEKKDADKFSKLHLDEYTFPFMFNREVDFYIVQDIKKKEIVLKHTSLGELDRAPYSEITKGCTLTFTVKGDGATLHVDDKVILDSEKGAM